MSFDIEQTQIDPDMMEILGFSDVADPPAEPPAEQSTSTVEPVVEHQPTSPKYQPTSPKYPVSLLDSPPPVAAPSKKRMLPFATTTTPAKRIRKEKEIISIPASSSTTESTSSSTASTATKSTTLTPTLTKPTSVASQISSSFRRDSTSAMPKLKTKQLISSLVASAKSEMEEDVQVTLKKFERAIRDYHSALFLKSIHLEMRQLLSGTTPSVPERSLEKEALEITLAEIMKTM